jgi:aminomethyltransferase
MLKKTALYEQHQQAGAKLVDFAGWEMPLHYGSQLEEHHKVRRDAGMFDVSHMAIVDIYGKNAHTYLRYLLANDVARLTQPGKALYTCMLNEHGGIIDDLIVYFVAPAEYRLVVNAGTRDKDLAWIKQQAQNFTLTITERVDLSILAIQGPNARKKALQTFDQTKRAAAAELKPFHFARDKDWFIARTGYTGEDGFEIMLPAKEVADFWQALLQTDISPCGLGARDTLRLEAGLNLYGADMDETTTPLESNLNWTVQFEPQDRDFIGRRALEQQQKQGIQRKLVGLVLEERGVLRSHQQVIAEGIGAGEITSGSFSPSLGFSVALARVPANIGTHCHVVIRDKLIAVRIVKPPFVKQGKKVFE